MHDVPWCYSVIIGDGLDGWITAECVDLDGCFSQGATREEALANIREAIAVTIDSDDFELEVVCG